VRSAPARPRGTPALARLGLLAVSGWLLGSCERETRAVTVVPEDPPVTVATRVEEPPPPQPEHTELPGGLVRDLVHPGRRLAARVGDRLRIHCTVRSADGATVYESTLPSGVPQSIVLGHGEVIAGLDRGLIGVWEGAEVKLHVPAALAYGERGLGAVPPGSDLLLEVRVVSIERP